MDSEIIGMALAGEEAEWLKNPLTDFPLWNKPVPAISLHSDSRSVIDKISNKTYNGKSRHIRMRHNLLRQLLKRVIAIDFVGLIDNLTNPLTKGLAKEQVTSTSREMRLKPKKTSHQ